MCTCLFTCVHALLWLQDLPLAMGANTSDTLQMHVVRLHTFANHAERKENTSWKKT